MYLMKWYCAAKGVWLHPKEFFKNMPTTGGLGEPFKFALINLVITAIIFSSNRFNADNNIFIWTNYIFIGILSLPQILMCVVIIITGIAKIILNPGNRKKYYAGTYMTLAYLSLHVPLIAFLLILIGISPIFWTMILFYIEQLYSLYATGIAFEKVYEIKWLQPIISMLIDIGVFIIASGILLQIFLVID